MLCFSNWVAIPWRGRKRLHTHVKKVKRKGNKVKNLINNVVSLVSEVVLNPGGYPNFFSCKRLRILKV